MRSSESERIWYASSMMAHGHGLSWSFSIAHLAAVAITIG